jgi:hypothetical protein
VGVTRALHTSREAMLERRARGGPHNRRVGGSSPPGPTNKIWELAIILLALNFGTTSGSGDGTGLVRLLMTAVNPLELCSVSAPSVVLPFMP